MPKTRSYKLLCPIARALDRVGDRWTLLILRDLHAGPARFTDLQRGLSGIAANLLAERLAKLVEDGLAVKGDGGHGTSVYALTGLGERTLGILFELAVFGSAFPAGDEIVRPGNLRTVATTLSAALARVRVPDRAFEARLLVDGEEMCLSSRDGRARVVYGPSADPDLVVTTSYEDLLAVSEGEIAPEIFLRDRAVLDVRTAGADGAFAEVMAAILGASGAMRRSPSRRESLNRVIRGNERGARARRLRARWERGAGKTLPAPLQVSSAMG